MQEPRIAIDDKQALKTIVGIAATGGTAYLGTKVLEGAESPCYTALQGTKYANKFPKPTGVTATTKEVYQDTTKALEQEVDIWKNNMKKSFNTLRSEEHTTELQSHSDISYAVFCLHKI